MFDSTVWCSLDVLKMESLRCIFFFELAIKQQEVAWLLSKKVSDDRKNMWNSVKYLNQVLIKPKMKCVQEK